MAQRPEVFPPPEDVSDPDVGYRPKEDSYLSEHESVEAREVGTLLRQTRESKGLSIDEMAKQTRLRASHLTSLEAGEIGKLPGTAFVAGFMRLYAKNLDLAHDPIIIKFLVDFESQRQNLATETFPSPTTSRQRPSSNAVIFGIIGLLALSFAYSHYFPDAKSDSQQLPASPPLKVGEVAPVMERPLEESPQEEKSVLHYGKPAADFTAEKSAAANAASAKKEAVAKLKSSPKMTTENQQEEAFAMSADNEPDRPLATVANSFRKPLGSVAVNQEAKAKTVAAVDEDTLLDKLVAKLNEAPAALVIEPEIAAKIPPLPKTRPVLVPAATIPEQVVAEFPSGVVELPPVVEDIAPIAPTKPSGQITDIAPVKIAEPQVVKPVTVAKKMVERRVDDSNLPPRKRIQNRYPEPIKDQQDLEPDSAQAISLVSIELVWVQIQDSKGSVLKDMVMQPDHLFRVPDGMKFFALLGNAAAVQVRIGNNKLPPLGGPGEVVENLELSSAALLKKANRR